MVSISRSLLPILFTLLTVALPCAGQVHSSWREWESYESFMLLRNVREQRISVASSYSNDSLRQRLEFDTAGRLIYYRGEDHVVTYHYDSLGRLVHTHLSDQAVAGELDQWLTYDGSGRLMEQRTRDKSTNGRATENLIRYQYETDGIGIRRTTFNRDAIVMIEDSSVARRERRVVDYSDRHQIIVTRYDSLWRPVGIEEYVEDPASLPERDYADKRGPISLDRRAALVYDDGIVLQYDTTFTTDTLHYADTIITEIIPFACKTHRIDSNAHVVEWQSFMLPYDTSEPPTREASCRAEFDEHMRPLLWRYFGREKPVAERSYTYLESGLLAATRTEYFFPGDINVGEPIVEERWQYEFHPPAPREKGKIR